LKDGLRDLMEDTDSKISSVIWLRKLGRVAQELGGSRARKAEQGMRETASLMAMAHHRLREEFGTKGAEKRIHMIQSAGRIFLR